MRQLVCWYHFRSVLCHQAHCIKCTDGTLHKSSFRHRCWVRSSCAFVSFSCTTSCCSAPTCRELHNLI
ncbi:hypothetical protein HBI56_059800 [Parastagonospora nodorum]|uniref:Uncharacterized protein n=1 Tax=Phaeosphaeria nodorum (strain SN15 / ATCC MYA-4574 / FGSC 10173) TaxID=321614 RepID=A0A7U2F6E8_PHANO|nr:hypothetical protein HBH56_158810 [Parastagonospora nodorum]QRC97355.1 hypothetical protein JI435_410480 [Parastagonospora nodorum SN15]KAH3922499.1 hypothetical protein HBH54_223240 [Parastagonospora nodorum]KAH3947054.1 hypothetical protein HBH53_123100 [Parastagonospora nodorum]KAH3969552.1 hypothetical protein HBH52_171110 [Parastagonospora nodorum]